MNEKQAMILQNDLVQVCEKTMMVKQPKTLDLYKKIVFDTSVEWAEKNGFKHIKQPDIMLIRLDSNITLIVEPYGNPEFRCIEIIWDLIEMTGGHLFLT